VDWYYFAMVVYFYSGHWWIFTPALTMNDRKLQDIIQYTLRRWLRSQRSPDDARLGAKKIVRQLRLCGVINASYVGAHPTD